VTDLAALLVRWMEAVRDRDMPWLEAFLAPEFRLVTGRPGAEWRGREEWLEVTRSGYVIETFAFEEIDVNDYGDAAVLRSRYSQVGRLGDEDRTQTFLMTDVLIRRGGRWQAVTRHISPLPPSR
jgi:ketosteroid isomerase-like protein